jgi:hypothetical protein
LLVLYLLTSTVGALVGGAFSGVASAIGGLGKTVAQTAALIIAESNPLDAIEAQIRATGTDPEALNVAAINAARKLSSEADAAPAREEARGPRQAPVASRLSEGEVTRVHDDGSVPVRTPITTTGEHLSPVAKKKPEPRRKGPLRDVPD